MCWSRFAVLVCLLLASPLAGAARASGLLIPRDGSAPIQVQSHRVTASVEDGWARTNVRQTFVNPHGRALEAVYVFPVPEGAALVDLALEVGGQRLEGFLAERRTARRAYDSLVRRRRDPALLEQIGRSTFRLSVFPVMPDQATVVELTWIEAVPLVRGEVRYVFPLGLSVDPVETEQDLTVAVTVKSSAPIVSVDSPTAGMTTRKVDEHEARASLEVSKARLAEDVVVVAKVAALEPALAVRVYRPPEGDSYFAAVLTPPDLREEQVLPRDITLALDVSGSMARGKLAQAKSAALWLLERLRPNDRVNVLLFNDTVRRFAADPQAANGKNLEGLRAFVEQAAAGGATALGDAIAAACSASSEPGRVALVVILTDGLPTVGEVRPEAIVGYSGAAARRGLRTFTFGVGRDVDAALLEGVATAGAGSAEVFRPEGEIETRLRAFLTRTESPAIANLRVAIDGQPVDDLLPRPLQDVYLGEQAIITGRFAGSGRHEFTVTGVYDGLEIIMKTSADLGLGAARKKAARDLYARAKLDFLQRALRLRTGLSDAAYFAALDRGRYDTEDELVGAQIELSLETGVQCAYTSLIALLPEDRRRLNPRDAEALEQALKRANARRVELAGVDAPSPMPEETVVLEDEVLEEAFLPAVTMNDQLNVGGSGGGRFGGRYGGRGAVMGGGRAGQSAVEWSTFWLSRHQDPSGRWSGTGFQSRCTSPPCTGADAPEVGVHEERDAGVTGLALLALLGAGQTAGHGQYKLAVREGLKYLSSIQDPTTGCFGEPDETDLEDHVLATLAMTEGYGLSKWPLLKQPAARGIEYLVTQWGQAAADGEPCHPAALGFGVLVLESARQFGLPFDAKLFDTVLKRIEECRGTRGDATGALASIEILCRIFRGEDPTRSDPLRAAADRLLQHLPNGNGSSGAVEHRCSWLFGSYAMFQLGGTDWEQWQEEMLCVLVTSAKQDGCAKGSWEPWAGGAGGAGRGGRIYSTAVMTLCVEVTYRYDCLVGAR